jgi:signal transduction histidine kinase/ABC-type uncharacterized transport system substrate-binding protein
LFCFNRHFKGARILLGRESICKSGAAVLLLILLVFSNPSRLYAEDSPRNILLLNSYHQGLFWTDDEVNGILDVLKKRDGDFDISIEYMDWKAYASYANLNANREYLKFKYADKKTDLVITTDDIALEFALANRAELFSDAPVVFCGVNENGAKGLLEGKSRVTGVIQEINPGETIQAAMAINPSLKKVYLVYDKSDSGQSTGLLTIKAIRSAYPSLELVLLGGKKTEEIFDIVSHAGSDSIVISTNYLMDADGNSVGFEFFSRKLGKSSSVPVYNLYEEAINNGAVGGSMISGKLQGESAGRIALRVLGGEEIDAIPFDRTPTTRLLFDYYLLKRFNIEPSSLPPGSTIANEPSSVLKEYKSFVINIVVVISSLLLLIILLLYYLSKIKRMKEDLSKNNLELSGLYQDLSLAGAKLQQQFDELSAVQDSLVSSERRFSLLFEKMLNGFCVVEPVFGEQGKIADIRFKAVNPGLYKQMEKTGAEVVNKNWFEVFGYQNKELPIYQRLLKTGGSERFETYYPEIERYYAGNIFWISGTEFGLLFDNITAYKMAIKEVKQLNASLEQRVRDRTKELQLALDELEAFSYTVSHDLKSPLRAIDGYSRIILEDLGPRMDEDSKEIMGNISKISTDMIDMINKLLQYSTTSRAELNKEEVDIRAEFLSVFEGLRVIHPERDISLIIETGMPTVYADRILFRQLIQNILSNAVKFTRDREKAVIRVGCTITQEKYAFYVKDNGVGFDMEYSGKLFGIFQRLHTEDEFEGSGVGLVTVRKIVEKHGGQVWIEGKVNEGATIYFTVPFSWEKTERGAADV